MSLSRLIGLVSVLVLGTLLSVWWYLQVPEASQQGLASAAAPIERDTHVVPARGASQPLSGSQSGIEAGPRAIPAATSSVILVPSLPTSVAPTPSGRWTRRVSTDPLARTARARQAALQGATPAEYMRGVPIPNGKKGPRTPAGASSDPACPVRARLGISDQP